MGLGCLAFVIAFLSGPRVMINTRLQPVILPEDIEQYVADSESGFDDIVPGAEKKIFWADKQHSRTPFAVIYLHGFSATRQETAPLSQKVAQRFGANLFCTRLTGHGRDGKAMLDGSVNAWLNDAAETLKIGQQIGEKIIIIGTSTGGDHRQLAGSPANRKKHCGSHPDLTQLRSSQRHVGNTPLPWGGILAELIIGKERGWGTQKSRPWEILDQPLPHPGTAAYDGNGEIDKIFGSVFDSNAGIGHLFACRPSGRRGQHRKHIQKIWFKTKTTNPLYRITRPASACVGRGYFV